MTVQIRETILGCYRQDKYLEHPMYRTLKTGARVLKHIGYGEQAKFLGFAVQAYENELATGKAFTYAADKNLAAAIARHGKAYDLSISIAQTWLSVKPELAYPGAGMKVITGTFSTRLRLIAMIFERRGYTALAGAVREVSTAIY